MRKEYSSKAASLSHQKHSDAGPVKSEAQGPRDTGLCPWSKAPPTPATKARSQSLGLAQAGQLLHPRREVVHRHLALTSRPRFTNRKHFMVFVKFQIKEAFQLLKIHM